MPKFRTDSRRTPRRVLTRHAPNQLSDLGVDLGPAWSPSRLPSPVEPETHLTPLNHGIGLDDDEDGPPIRPDAGQPSPEDPVAFLSRGRLDFCSRIASCCRKARFSVANSAWLRRSDRKGTNIICVHPILNSQTLHLNMYVNGYERSRAAGSVNADACGNARNHGFRPRMRFSGGTA